MKSRNYLQLHKEFRDDQRNKSMLEMEINCGDFGDSSSIIVKESPVTCNGTSDGDHFSLETYRCTIKSDSSAAQADAKSSYHVEHRCKINVTIDDEIRATDIRSQTEIPWYCGVDDQRVVKLSTSLTNSSISEQESFDVARKAAFEEWLQKKKQDDLRRKQEKEMEEARRLALEEKLQKEKEKKEQIERENFLKWRERKKKEEADKKAMFEKDVELKRRLKAVEDTAATAKALCLQQWAKKKLQEQKAQVKEKEKQLRKIEEERKKRMEESTKAYEQWRESSKNKPKPATQGLLPHQKAKPAFVNPVPWQGLVENGTDEDKTTKAIDKNRPKNRSKKITKSLKT
ncbi:coiled-coil domain-containing protein 34-like [Prorops nasuta]|uniref:coiled-coil domain-containing protein 34-like n=1 Tax=Prorops nasuta TaxID=863751 RepID=UPI0034CEFC86